MDHLDSSEIDIDLESGDVETTAEEEREVRTLIQMVDILREY